MINWTKRFVGVLAIATLICSTAMATDLNVSVTSGGSDTITVVPCGGTLAYEVRGVLTDSGNLGLAGFVFDLTFSGGSLDPADAPSADPMLSFDRPAGMTAAGGFGGTVVDGRLVHVGGAQNTPNNTADNAPFPIGTVITGVAHTEEVLVTGLLTAPIEPGTYTLTLSNLGATVIVGDDQATGFWVVEPPGVGSIGNLTVVVPPAEPPATASNDGPACEGENVTLLGGPDGMAGYSWTGPGGFTSTQQNPVISPPIPGIYTLTVTDSNDCIDRTRTTVALLPGPCDPFVDCNNNGVHDGCEADTDEDGLIDGCDNCPNDPNPNQEDGDGDGIGDACENDPPECAPSGPYSAECAGATTTVQLDGSGSSDPNPGDTLTFAWTTDCPGGSFDDPNSPTPLLTVSSVAPCPLVCNVTLTVTDNRDASDTCSTTVTINDTTAPVLSVDTTPITVTDVDCSGDEAVTLPTATATDICGAATVTNDAPVTFPADTTTTVTFTATDACGNTSSTAAVDVTVLFGADIWVEAARHTVGSGSHPGSSKDPLVGIDVCAYDKSDGSCARVTCGGISHREYECIATTCTAVNCCTTDANGECTINLPPGDYIVISNDATKTVLPDPLGVSASDLLCGELMRKHLQQIVTLRGRTVPGKTTRRGGSELLIIEPEFIVWDAAEQLYPFVFEATGGWGVNTTLAPPRGFVADVDSLSATVINEIEAMQFTITEIGSHLEPTRTTFDLFHLGGRSIVQSHVDILLTVGYAVSRGYNVDELRHRGLIYAEDQAAGAGIKELRGTRRRR
ncbi:MAG: thrombospondin type 3 repeat-containing protein [Phycisphaerae bacterium]